MHRTWLLILSLLVVFPTAGLARIGEHLPDCIYRYGKPLNPDAKDNRYVFSKEGFLIAVMIHREKVEMISYQKAERNILNQGAPLSDNEVELLMQINGGARKWKKRAVISMTKEWETEDGTLFSSYDPLENTCCVFTKECAQRSAAEQKAKEKQSIEGL
jgi:hypothetical protein